MFFGLLGIFLGMGLALGFLVFLVVRLCVFVYKLIRG